MSKRAHAKNSNVKDDNPTPPKSPKHCSNSNGQGPQSKMEFDEPEDSFSISNLASLLSKLSKPTTKEPDLLTTLEVSDIEVYFEQLSAYQKQGGEKGSMEFIDKAVLQAICELLLQDYNASEEKVIAYLRSECKPSTVEQIHEALQHGVEIDPDATSAKSKILSLFTSLNRVLTKLDMAKGISMSGEYNFPFEKQKQLILSKTPVEFQSDFQTWSLYKTDATSNSVLYQQLLQVAKAYTGSWDTESRQSDGRTRYAREMDRYEQDFKGKSGRMKLRSGN